MATKEQYDQDSEETKEDRYNRIKSEKTYAHDLHLWNYVRLWLKMLLTNYPIGFQPTKGELVTSGYARVVTPRDGQHLVKVDRLRTTYQPDKKVLLSKHDL